MYEDSMAEIKELHTQVIDALGFSGQSPNTTEASEQVVLNTLPWNRFQVLPSEGRPRYSSNRPNYIASQVPANSVGSLLAKTHQAYTTTGVQTKQLGPNIYELSNKALKLRVEGHTITSLVDLNTNRELVGEGLALNQLAMFDDRPPGAYVLQIWDETISMRHNCC